MGNLHMYLPTWHEYPSARTAFERMQGGSRLTSPGWVRYEFPYVGDALNDVAFPPLPHWFCRAPGWQR